MPSTANKEEKTIDKKKSLSFTKKSSGAIFLATEFDKYQTDPNVGINYWLVTTDDINIVYENNIDVFSPYSKKALSKNFISHANDYRISAIKSGARKGSKFLFYFIHQLLIQRI